MLFIKVSGNMEKKVDMEYIFMERTHRLTMKVTGKMI
jgi:hypothetical protein